MVSLLLLPKKIPLLFLLIFLSLFFSSASLYSQVKIKEKVAINPISSRLSTTTNYSPIEFLFHSATGFSATVAGPGGSASGGGGGPDSPLLLFALAAVNGEYQVTVSSDEDYVSTVGFSVTWVAPDGSTRFLAGYQMAFYFGGTRTATFTFNEIPPPPPPFDFQISFDNNLAYGTDKTLFRMQYNHNSEPQDISVTLSFATADPDVVFYDGMLQEELGNSITASLDDYDRYSVTCKSLNSSFPKKVKVIGVSNGLERSDTLTILQSENVRAYFEKESLSPGDTVNIIIKKVNNGWKSNYPDSTHFEVGIKEGCGLGMIMDANGTKRDHFSSIQQPIRFLVADSISVETDSVVLRVGAPIVGEGDVVASSVIPTGNNLQKNKSAVNQNMSTEQIVNKKRMLKALDDNSCTVYTPIYTNVSDAIANIENIKIKITLIGSSEIWPYKAVSAGYISTTNAKIKVTNGDKPLESEPVKITIKRIDGSGGHDHPNSSDLTLWGRISVNGVTGNPVTAYTDQNGEIYTQEIRSSEFGGEYFIEASLEENSGIKDKVDLIVKVPGLLLLPENNYYSKTGGTTAHHGPRIDGLYPNDRFPDNNHWINEIALNTIVTIAKEFVDDKSNRTGKLKINDLSLPYGGLFDYKATWNTPHKFHRIGVDVDIENKNLFVIKSHMSKHGWKYFPEAENFYLHFHFIR